MKKVFLFSLFALFFISCRSTLPEGVENRSLFAEDAYELIQNEPAFLLDLRGDSWVQTGKIKTAMVLNFESESFSNETESLSRDVLYLLYCDHGFRSKKARKIMLEQGFTRVYDIRGGMQSWLRWGLPVVFD